MKIQDKDVPSLFQRKVCWAALTGLALLVVVALVCGLLFGVGSLFVALEPVLLPVVIAGFLAYLLSPCVALVQRRITKRLWAVVSVMLLAGAVLVALGWTIVPPLVQQTGDLVSKREQILESVVEGGKTQMAENRLLQQGVDMLYSKTLKDARAAELPVEDYENLSQETTYEGKLKAILSFNSSYLTETLMAWLTAGSRALSGVTMALVGTVMVPVFLFYFLLALYLAELTRQSAVLLWIGILLVLHLPIISGSVFPWGTALSLAAPEFLDQQTAQIIAAAACIVGIALNWQLISRFLRLYFGRKANL